MNNTKKALPDQFSNKIINEIVISSRIKREAKDSIPFGVKKILNSVLHPSIIVGATQVLDESGISVGAAQTSADVSSRA